MDKLIDARFERVEKALATLIDSIAKYTPSLPAASELASADHELSLGLGELQTHQNNHARIEQLRRETADLDAQIRATVATLWATRREITGTTTTTYPPADGKRRDDDFSYEDLLSYARRISRTTLPPPGVTNGVDLSAPAAADKAPATGGQDGAGSGSRVGTPAAGGGGASAAATPAATPAAAGSFSGMPSQPSQATQTSASTALPEHLLPAVNLLEGAVFFPWPGEERIRGGALALNQQLMESGIEPRGYDPEEEEARRRAAEEQRREAEERQRAQREEHERRMREEGERMARERAERAAQGVGEPAGDAWRRGSVVVPRTAGATSPVEKKQFQFMGDLDDDDEDD